MTMVNKKNTIGLGNDMCLLLIAQALGWAWAPYAKHLSAINGRTHIGGPSTTHRRLAPLPSPQETLANIPNVPYISRN